MIRETLAVGLLQCNCTILGDETAREAIVVDPGDGNDLDRLRDVLARHGLTVKAIVITHAHIDHIGGAAKLKASTGAPVYMNSADHDLYQHLEVQAAWLSMPVPERTGIDSEARDGDALRLGEAALHLIHTPGHTQGSVCLYCPSEHLLLAGDTLFRDSIGRTDLPGGDGRKILESIHTRLLTLPEETEVICGHGSGTTIGREKEWNPFLR